MARHQEKGPWIAIALLAGGAFLLYEMNKGGASAANGPNASTPNGGQLSSTAAGRRFTYMGPQGTQATGTQNQILQSIMNAGGGGGGGGGQMRTNPNAGGGGNGGGGNGGGGQQQGTQTGLGTSTATPPGGGTMNAGGTSTWAGTNTSTA